MTVFTNKEFTSQTISGLLEYQEFSDVTLATADNEQFHLHRIILSASSPFFKNVLLKNIYAKPFIYLQGMMYEPLRHIVEFIYTGQCKVPVAILNSFLKIGKDLEIHGLVKVPDDTFNNKAPPSCFTDISNNSAENYENQTNIPQDYVKTFTNHTEIGQDNILNNHHNIMINLDDCDPPKPDKNYIDLKSDDQDNTTCHEGFPETPTDRNIEQEKYQKFPKSVLKDIIDNAKYSQAMANLNEYYEKNDIDPIPTVIEKETSIFGESQANFKKGTFLGKQEYKCEQCDYKSSYRPHIKSHQHFVHNKITNELLFPCGKCDKVLISDLKRKKHNNIHHNPDAYKCDTCGKILSNRGSLKTHKAIKHSQEKLV